jgi:hypothetical protein
LLQPQMTTLLPELAALIRTATALEVHPTAPKPGVDGVFLWVWRIDSEQMLNRPPPVRQPGLVVPAMAKKLQLMLLVQSNDQDKAIASLLACETAINNSPVLRAAHSEGRIVQSALANPDLFSLFIASGIRLQPCLSFTLTVTTTA